MATAWQTFPIEFRGGLRSDLGVLPQGMNEPGSATFLQNFEPAKEGGYRRIQGFQKFDDQAVTGTGAILGVVVTSSTEVVAARDNGTTGVEFWSSSGAGWTSLGTFTSVPDQVRFTRFKFGTDEKLFITDGSNYAATLNLTSDVLTALSSITDLLGASYSVVFKQHIFCANGSLLYFSEPYDETAWTPGGGAGVINVGSTITGLAVFRDELFIFSRDKIQKITGSSVSDFAMSPVAENMGCVDGDTIQEIGGDVAFMAPDGLRLLSATDRNNDFSLDLLSDKIPREFKSFNLSNSRFVAITIRGKAQYRIFGYNTSTHAENAEGLLFTKFSDQGASDIAWSTTKGIRAYCADSYYTLLGEKVVFAHTDGYVYSLEVGNSFDGAEIEAIYRSPNIPIEDPKVRKTLYRVLIYTDTTGSISFTMNLGYDMPRVTNYNKVVAPAVSMAYTQSGVFVYGNPSAVYGVATYGAPVDTVFETPIIGSGKTFYFEIRDQSTNPPFSIDTAVFDYLPHDKQ